MDQIKIGKFIAQRRKLVNLTQLQLAEMLGITDRAVSKWETGKTMPDSSLMLELCGILKITVNDLLSGEEIIVDNYTQELENKLIEVIRQKEQKDKQLLNLEIVVGILSSLILIAPIFVAALLPMADWVRVVLILSGIIPGGIGLFFAVKIEQSAGYYCCARCQHSYVPTMRAVVNAPHMGRTRYMRCPQCNQKSWHKKILQK